MAIRGMRAIVAKRPGRCVSVECRGSDAKRAKRVSFARHLAPNALNRPLQRGLDKPAKRGILRAWPETRASRWN